MASQVKLADIARLAGCSPAQASRAINGLDLVSPDTRAKVLAIAKELNYRNTASNHRPKIVICRGNSFGSYEVTLLRELTKQLKRKNWSCLTVEESDWELIQDFFFDGAIIIGTDDANIAQHWKEHSQIPLVVINGYGSGSDMVSTIDPDRNNENTLVLSFLKELGHKRIARIQKSGSNSNARYRNRGENEFLSAAASLDMLFSVRNVVFEKNSELTNIIRELLNEKFTAFFVVHQEMALRASAALRELGVRCPEDVSLITYEVDDVSEFLNPPHTTLDFNYEQLAQIAIQELSDLIKGIPKKFRVSFNVPNILRKRGTTGPFPGE